MVVTLIWLMRLAIEDEIFVNNLFPVFGLGEGVFIA